MSAINPEFRDLEQQVAQLRDRLARAEGEIQQLNRTASDNTRQTIWQFVIFTVTMAGVLIGALNYQTNALRNEINARFAAMDERFTATQKQAAQMETNLNTRFEDLRQEVRAIRR